MLRHRQNHSAEKGMVRDELVATSMDANEKRPSYSWLIFFIGHCGSSAFTQQLGWHPNIKVSGFEPLERYSSSEALEYTSKLFEDARLDYLAGKRVSVGFKLRTRSIGYRDIKQWTELIQKHNTRVIWLNDENILRTVTGDLANRHVLCKVCSMAGMSDLVKAEPFCQHCMARDNPSALQFLLRDKFITQEDITSTFPVILSIDQILSNAFLETGRQWILVNHVFTIMGRLSSTLHLTYHDIMTEPDTTLARGLEYIGVENSTLHLAPPQGARPFVKSSGKLPWCAKISNWPTICRSFGSCKRFDWMLEDAEHDGCSCHGLQRNCTAEEIRVDGVPPLQRWSWYNSKGRR